jgi:hypothetical protein
MRLFLIGTTVLLLALLVSFCVEGVLENTAMAPMRDARTAVADGPTKAGKPSPVEQSRTGSTHQ